VNETFRLDQNDEEKKMGSVKFENFTKHQPNGKKEIKTKGLNFFFRER
jgi:hypothetical protein